MEKIFLYVKQGKYSIVPNTHSYKIPLLSIYSHFAIGMFSSFSSVLYSSSKQPVKKTSDTYNELLKWDN